MAGDSAGGKEVGRISIRVVPNLEKFRSDLQRELDEIEDSIKAHVNVVPNMDEFREKVDAATRDLKDAHVKVKTDFDRRGDLVHDLDSAVEDAGKRSKGAKVDVVPHINQSSFQKALRDVKAQAKLADLKLDVDFKDKNAEKRLAELIGRLKTEAKLANIKVDVETRHRGELGSVAGSAANAGAGFGGGALRLLTDQTALIAVAIVGLLAPALALLSSALVGLPALVSAVAIPLGVLALGKNGIEKALEDVGILNQEKNKKGGDKGKPKVGDLLKQIEKPIDDVFEKGLVPILNNIIGVLPQLTSALPKVASGLVDIFRSVTGVFTSPAGLASIQNLTGNVGKLLSGMAPGIASFSNSILNLASKVSNHFPGLSSWFNQLGDKVSGWVDKITKPGPKNWFTGQDTPSGLDKAMTNLRPTLDGIVHFVGELMDAGLKMAQDPKMGDNIKTTLSSIADFVTNTLPDLVSVFQQVANIAKELGLVSGADHKPKTALDGTNPDGKPGFNGTQLNGAGTRPGSPAEHLAQGAHKLGDEVKSRGWVAGLFQNFVRDGMDEVGGWLSHAHKSLTRPHTDHPAIVEGNVGQQAPQPQKPAAPAAPVGAADGGAGAVKTQLGAVQGAVDPAMAAISASTSKAWDGFVTATKKATADVMAEVNSWPGKIKGVLQGLAGDMVGIGTAIGQGLANGIKAGTAGAVAAATDLANQVEAATRNALKTHSPSQVFDQIGQDTAQGYQNGLEGGFQGVIDSARGLAKQVSDAMSGGAPGDIGGSAVPHGPDSMPSVSGARPNFQTDLPGAGDAPGGGIMVPTGFQNKSLQDQIKQQVQALDIEKQRLKIQYDGTADKGLKSQLKSQMDQLDVAKSQLGLSKDQLKSGGDSNKQKMDALDIQEQQLRTQMDATHDKGKKQQLQQQMDALKAQKDQLKLDELQNPKSKDKKSEDMNQQLAGQLNKAIDIGKNFAMANVKQFEGDVGISGNGALPQLMDQGLSWVQGMLGNLVTGAMGGSMGGKGKTEIHVHSVDEAMAVSKNKSNQEAHQYAGR